MKASMNFCQEVKLVVELSRIAGCGVQHSEVRRSATS